MLGKKYTIFHLPLLSFFSKRLYRDVGQNWKGANLSYLFLLLAICCIPLTLRLREGMIHSLGSNQTKLINQIPDIHIKNGQVSVDQKQPYHIMRNGETIAIIDTTGSMNYIDDEHVMALLTESKLIIRRGKNQFNTLDLSLVSEFHLNRHIASQWIQTTKNSLAPLSYGLFLLLSYTFAVLLMLLVAVVGLMISTTIHSPLKFSGILRIAATAATPSIILITISAALGQPIPSPIYIAVTLLYLVVGIISCTKPVETEKILHIKLSDLLTTKNQYDHAA